MPPHHTTITHIHWLLPINLTHAQTVHMGCSSSDHLQKRLIHVRERLCLALYNNCCRWDKLFVPTTVPEYSLIQNIGWSTHSTAIEFRVAHLQASCSGVSPFLSVRFTLHCPVEIRNLTTSKWPHLQTWMEWTYNTNVSQMYSYTLHIWFSVGIVLSLIIVSCT